MGVVSFRIADDDEKRLERAGVNPGLAAKAHIEAEARRLRADEYFARLEPYTGKSPVPVDGLIREMREEE